MRKIRLLIPLLLGMALFCSKQVETIGSDLLPGDAPEVVCQGITRDIVEISADDAVKVAMMRGGSEKTKGAATERTVKEVKTISSEDGVANIYAVNYADDKGFTLVSATKNYFPVLAEVESGSFDDGIYETGAAVLLDQYNNDIEYCRTLPEDSLRRFRALWREYEQKNEAKPKVTKDGDPLAVLISTSFAAWRAAGYEIYDLGGGAPEDLPQSVYDSWYSIAEGVANEDYDIDNNAFILRRRETIISERGPLMSTTWHQNPPYSNTAGSELGCATIAAGQIMKYHESPACHNWSAMPNSLASSTSGTTVLSDFLKNLGEYLGIDYSSGDSGVYIGVVKQKLNQDGYTCSLVTHNYFDSWCEVYAGYPIYMRGTRYIPQEENHAWVCDGGRNTLLRETYTLMVISDVAPPLQWETPCDPYEYTEGNISLHMNWGWGGSANGWYVDNQNYASVNYTYDRKDLIEIRP